MDLYNTRDRTQDIQDVKTKSKILPRYSDKIQDLTKKSKIDSKNIFVEHVDLLQAMLPATDQCPYSEVEALC